MLQGKSSVKGKNNMNKKKFFKNISVSVFVQIVSLLTSFVVSLVVPKYISILDYSRWQSYVLYSSYVSIFHFGLIDGFVLRYSKYNYEELDHEEVRSQLQVLLAFLTILSIVTVIFATLFFHGTIKILVCLIAVSIVVKNHYFYSSTIFQITYRIDKYSKITIFQRGAYLVGVVFLLLVGARAFYWFCIADIVGDILSGALAIKYNKELTIGKIKSLKTTLKCMRDNIKFGMVLLFANYSTALIIGSAKMIGQFKWGEVAFGKISFGFSLTNLFLAFITAISVVLFPSLKRIDEKELPQIYFKIRNLSTVIMFLGLALYHPIALIINTWIPEYSESIRYMLYLLPMIVFCSRTNLLTNNYLKIFMREKQMLIINSSFALIGIGVYSLFAFFFNNVIAMLISVAVIEMLKFFISEIVVCIDIKKKNIINIFTELLVIAVFYLTMTFMTPLVATLVYLFFALVYVVLNFIISKKLKFKESCE